MTSERNSEIVRLRQQGWTLEEIGRRFSISRERVRQIAQAGGAFAETASAGKRRSRLAEAERAERALIDGFRAGRAVSDLARELGLSRPAADAVVRTSATPADRAERKRSNSETRHHSRYTHEDLVRAVESVEQHVGRVPSSQDYRELAGDLDLPSLPTVCKRFGTWTEAVRAAGMAPNPAPRSNYTRRWTEDACWHALVGLMGELESMPTADQYDVLASARDDLPSLATVHNRLGRWSEVTSTLLATPHDHPVLRRLGVSERAQPRERNERVWLAHLAGEVSDAELVALMRCHLFEWHSSYGPPPEG
jgi:hypothetical protein